MLCAHGARCHAPDAGEAMVAAQAATLLAWDAGSLLFSAAVAAFVAPYVPPSSRPAIGVPLCDSPTVMLNLHQLSLPQGLRSSDMLQIAAMLSIRAA